MADRNGLPNTVRKQSWFTDGRRELPVTAHHRKLIEVSLPLEAINAASAREKSIRHGHPSTLHLWWARRPLAACRAVLFAQIVDDPSSWPEEFPTEEAQARERKRLHEVIAEMVQWKASGNRHVMGKARYEIARSLARGRGETPPARGDTDAVLAYLAEHAPPVCDPFCGGGSIPLEAQRLGLRARGSDLNPVAVLVSKATCEIPPKFAGRPPVHPDADPHVVWRGARGLAEDVRYYGRWMRERAKERIGHLYPKAAVTAAMAEARPDLAPHAGRKITVIAWLWARTVASPDPMLRGAHVPLASSFVLSSKKGKEAIVVPVVENGGYRFTVKTHGIGPDELAKARTGAKVGRGANFVCLLSGVPISGGHIKAEGMAGRMGARLMAVVAEGRRRRVYLDPTEEMEAVAREAESTWRPEQELSDDPRNIWCIPYGFSTFADLFTPRQLTALTTFSDLVAEAHEQIRHDLTDTSLGTPASRRHEGEAPANENAGGTPAYPGGEHSGWYSRGYHPHFDSGDLVQSITFRLSDSVSQELLRRWRDEATHGDGAELRKRIAEYEDAGYGACHLRRPEIARMVQDALLHFDGERYRLIEWCIMPNHVHVLIEQSPGHRLSDIVQAWKSFSSKQANRLLGRSGPFWAREYFDRYIRDEGHLAAARRYIRENPVKARLCERAEDWPWSSATPGTRASGTPASRRHKGEAPANENAGGTPAYPGEDVPLAEGGTGAQAYADAVATYLGLGVGRAADYWSSIATWANSGEFIRSSFARQAIPMVWDFAESNPFSSASGNWGDTAMSWVARAVRELAPAGVPATVIQKHAAGETRLADGAVIATDPPYYDNIGYADLSDFFYVWQRRALRGVWPNLFRRLLAPKDEELVATPYRHGGKAEAERFFMDGMGRALRNMRVSGADDFPATLYYAFKQSEVAKEGLTSPGWATFLQGVVDAGYIIDGTWPVRTERTARSIGIGANALASSIVLVCRKRPADAPTITRRDFVARLRAELPAALKHIRAGGVGPVDMAQAALGPGMGVFTACARVLEPDDTPMTVRAAIALINRTRDEISGEEATGFDPETRFCIDWFEAFGSAAGDSGDAITLAQAYDIGIDALVDAGAVATQGGTARLLRRDELPADWNPTADRHLTHWECAQHLARVLESPDGGSEAAARLLTAMGPDNGEAARLLAYRLYDICERKGRADEARVWNMLAQEWPAVEAAVRRASEEAGAPSLL